MNEPNEPNAPSPLSVKELANRILAARIALALVGVVSLVMGIIETVVLNNELDKHGLGFDAIETPHLILLALAYVWSLGFIALSFVANEHPFGAALTGLVMVFVDLTLGAVLEPSTLHEGLLIKGLIIFVLARAVMAGRQHYHAVNAEQAEQAFA